MMDEIIKGLRICSTAEAQNECDFCPYRDKGFDCNHILMDDAAKALEELTADKPS